MVYFLVVDLREHPAVRQVQRIREVHRRRWRIRCGVPLLGDPGSGLARSGGGGTVEGITIQSSSPQHRKATHGGDIQDPLQDVSSWGPSSSPALASVDGAGRGVHGGGRHPGGLLRARTGGRCGIEAPPWPGDQGMIPGIISVHSMRFFACISCAAQRCFDRKT